MHYPLAKEAIFATFQGEGHLLGWRSIFVRLGGCSVGCPGCDTDYRVVSRATAEEIADRVSRLITHRYPPPWVWITGGEPADYDLVPLVESLRALECQLRIAVATAGTKPLPRGSLQKGGVDFLSVSPHSSESWKVRSGDQLNLVPGLNGLKLSAIEADLEGCYNQFSHRWVTPLEGSAESLQECLEFLGRWPLFRLGVQAHKIWGLP